jgi:hypothetical protein
MNQVEKHWGGVLKQAPPDTSTLIALKTLLLKARVVLGDSSDREALLREIDSQTAAVDLVGKFEALCKSCVATIAVVEKAGSMEEASQSLLQIVTVAADLKGASPVPAAAVDIFGQTVSWLEGALSDTALDVPVLPAFCAQMSSIAAALKSLLAFGGKCHPTTLLCCDFVMDLDHIKDAFVLYTNLGGNAAERLERDQGDVALRSLLSAQKLCDAASVKLSSADHAPGWLRQLRDALAVVVEESRLVDYTEKERRAQQDQTELCKINGGGPGGDVWTEGFEGETL